ncbi:MAG: hypothetical protein IJH86_02500 [Clostridia bacterium]|nr:hypothetical protein [Clostridia bacterium]
MIDRAKWNAYVDGKKAGITAIKRWEGVADVSDGWTEVSVKNDRFGANIYVKKVDGTLYWTSDALELYFPEDCESMFSGDTGGYTSLESFDMGWYFSTTFIQQKAELFYSNFSASFVVLRFFCCLMLIVSATAPYIRFGGIFMRFETAPF